MADKVLGTLTEREFESQPEVWGAVLDRRESSPFQDVERVVVFGSGTSYYLALLLADLLRTGLGLDAVAQPSCEVWIHPERTLKNPQTLFGVAVSRSGESSEAVLAARTLNDLGGRVLAISCHADSTLVKMADQVLLVPEGAEEGLVMSRSFSSMLLAVQKIVMGESGSNLNALPAAARRVLDKCEKPLKQLAHKTDFQRFVFLGSGVNLPLTQEAALKMQEMAIVTSEAYSALEYRHGPKATAGPDTLVTLFAWDSHRAEQRQLLKDLHGYGVTTLVIGENLDDLAAVSDARVELDSGLDETGRLALNLLPVHRLALETARRLGRDPDLSQNLTQVVRLAST
ncbi:SIS domain-containing protein [Deinococcus marmoris]|uniref:Glucosamine-6-phosphate deaminase, alternative n=1 Tax=Deinococcus marmoris TaxID=249408 RepID=A0A1U7NR48_9DEIO|nr:SIS domain-containing protein [Deinococcus marmoris]OLV15387.1 Glucosamine-6-phosphate deaminase, alternative [Deinococcus marmoris]